MPATIDIYAVASEDGPLTVQVNDDGSAVITVPAGAQVQHVAFQKPGGWDKMNRGQRFTQASQSVRTISSQILEALKARIGL